jgi:hypothetical protein
MIVRHEDYLPMISLGLKETKEVDFFEQFSDFILEHYSVEPSHYEDALLDLIDTRQVRTFARITMSCLLVTPIVLIRWWWLYAIINRHRERRRATLTAWNYYANTTTYSIMLSEDSSPLIAI